MGGRPRGKCTRSARRRRGIRNRIGEPLAAISVYAPAVRLREQDMPAVATALQETATTIARAE
ncbi:hypothetical protein GCM10010270_08280 [Streptomyces violaceus]|uniref:IclR family transcriptional regulator domain-containing protein n=1 Tax=Streptomyces violaceus TaxID=1936 RepID=UPI0018736BE3|nr:hypothetical protein GCM10010270_08280 [Streptomyces janthinus]